MCFDSRAACVLCICMCIGNMESTTNKAKGKLECCVIKRNEIISSTISQLLSRFEQENCHQSSRPLFVFVPILVLNIVLRIIDRLFVGMQLKFSWRKALFLFNKIALSVYMMCDKIE